MAYKILGKIKLKNTKGKHGDDCYIPNFWYVAVTGELVVKLSSHVYCMENYDNCMAVMINALVYGID